MRIGKTHLQRIVLTTGAGPRPVLPNEVVWRQFARPRELITSAQRLLPPDRTA